MPLFSSKEKDRKIKVLTQQLEGLKKQNENLTTQIRKYEGRFGDVKGMQGIIERLKTENQNLVNKLEKFVVERQQMRESVENLKKDLLMKREQIEMKTFAVTSEDIDIIVSKGITVNGGINAKKNVVVEEKAKVNGDIKAAGDILLGDEVYVKGFIEANSIKTGVGCTLDLVLSKGDLDIGNSTEVLKAVGGKVTLGNSVVIKDGIEYSDTMKIGSNVTIHGEIKTKP